MPGYDFLQKDFCRNLKTCCMAEKAMQQVLRFRQKTKINVQGVVHRRGRYMLLFGVGYGYCAPRLSFGYSLSRRCYAIPTFACKVMPTANVSLETD